MRVKESLFFLSFGFFHFHFFLNKQVIVYKFNLRIVPYTHSILIISNDDRDPIPYSFCIHTYKTCLNNVGQMTN